MQTITFHTLQLSDVEDPELYAAFPLSEFMDTEKGQWVKKNCADPQYIVRPAEDAFGYKIIVYGEVEDKLATVYHLKWS
jgi:hypothetical protein